MKSSFGFRVSRLGLSIVESLVIVAVALNVGTVVGAGLESEGRGGRQADDVRDFHRRRLENFAGWVQTGLSENRCGILSQQ